jgi:undecaprenyl phosphate-alpha-L-ara4N flippase subunit ArnE
VKTLPLLGLLLTVLCISIGQMLFKIAADRANVAQTLLAPGALSVLAVAVVLYGGATLVWVSVLRYVPLTVAYVFMSLSFVIVPALAAYFLHEHLTWRFIAGMALIVSGILVSLTGRAA